MMQAKHMNWNKLSIVLSLVALNLVIGSIVSFLKLPIYLDSLGIVIATLLVGWPWGVLAGLLTVGLGFFLINPYLPAYTGTSLGIVFCVALMRKMNLFSSSLRAAVSGCVVALVSATLSAPVTALLFEGSTLSGSDALTAFFLHTGQGIWKAVFLSGLSSEPVDKVIVCVVAFQILRAIPQKFVDANELKNFRNFQKNLSGKL